MKNIKIKLPFALNENNILVHISDVEKGKKCKCFCPSCSSPLIAAKGSIKQHHFKHAVDNECEHGLESAIHLAAKKLIMEKKKITLPEYICIASSMDSKGIKHTEREIVVKDRKIISFDSVQEEKELHGMKVDILAKKGNKPLIIEIFYRHKVEDHKIEKIKNANISAIEINLSDLTPEVVKNWETFWSCINDPKRVQWIYNLKAHDNVYPKLASQLVVRIRELEKEYEQKEIIKQRQEQKEKTQLLHALEELKKLCNKKYVEQIKQEAEMYPILISNNKYSQLSMNLLPNFLNIDVPNGDWIFGCDRRIWQTAFYNAFIRYKKGKHIFSIKRVHDWLQIKAECKVPRCAVIVGIYGRRYPELVPPEVSDNMPSSWVTLRSYFNHLCKLGMLEYSGNHRGHKGSSWFEVISNIPKKASQINRKDHNKYGYVFGINRCKLEI